MKNCSLNNLTTIVFADEAQPIILGVWNCKFKKFQLKQLKYLNMAKNLSRQSNFIENKPLLLDKFFLFIAQKLKVICA